LRIVTFSSRSPYWYPTSVPVAVLAFAAAALVVVLVVFVALELDVVEVRAEAAGVEPVVCALVEVAALVRPGADVGAAAW
jgi:hypothetical protein